MCKSVINAISFAGGGGGSVATGVLQIAGGVAIDGTLRAVEDQNGTDSMLQLSNAAVNIGSGTITNNGMLTIKGAGGNIQSFRSSANVEVGSITNAGSASFNGSMTILGGYSSYGTNEFYGSLIVSQNIRTNGNYLFSGTTSSFPAWVRNGVQIKAQLADGSGNLAGLVAGFSTTHGIATYEVSGAVGVGFFGIAPIVQPTTAIAEAAFVSGGSGTNVKTDDTFGGYTLQQIAQALQNLGLIA